MHPWEALLEIFVIFGCPRGARRAPFGEKKTSFLRSEILMILGWMGGSHWEGSAAEVDPLETLRVSIQSEYSV